MKRVMRSALVLVASSSLLLTQGCSEEEDLPWWLPPPWAPVFTTGISVNAGAAGGTGGGQTAGDQSQNQSLSGVARTGISGNTVPTGAAF